MFKKNKKEEKNTNKQLKTKATKETSKEASDEVAKEVAAVEQSENEYAIRVEHVDKVYKLYEKPSDRMKEALGFKKNRHTDHAALSDVNIDIKKGETVGIIGTNGSGKSTILKIITGVLSPSAGRVVVDGRISALLELGAGFNMEYNGIDNIYLNGTMIGFSEKEIDEKMDAILEFADIGEYVYQPVKTYSSGMFVRLAFAVAINIEPEILIVDEALSVGDVFFQAKCYHKFEEFKEQGKTILFVSHDLSSIAKYCDRVVLLNQGVKLGEGAPKEMIDIYKKVLVGQYEIPEAGSERLLDDDDLRKAAAEGKDKSKEIGHKADNVNPDLIEYGSEKAIISEYYITDEKGTRTSAILKGSRYSIHMKVDIKEDIPAPIFAFTVKNIRGTDITGTNTMIEKSYLEAVKAGETKEIVFTQHMNLQGGDYLLSLGCTGFEGDTFTVYHRLYDVLNMTVISDKDTVGYFDCESEVSVK